MVTFLNYKDRRRILISGGAGFVGSHLVKKFYVDGPYWGQSYKANLGMNYIKNGFNKLNFPLNYINFDVINAKKVL